jgi:hypothetical protein
VLAKLLLLQQRQNFRARKCALEGLAKQLSVG